MSTNEPHDHRSPTLLSLILALLNSDLIDLAGSLWKLGRRIVTAKAHEGMYEVLDLDVRLELLDARGSKAILYKRERIRFLQDNIIAYQDKAWGDGEIFADYRCSPGVAVDRYREGYRWRVLISLRETKNRGDVEEFNIERTIADGFTREVEEFQVEVDHATHKLSLGVVFPAKHPPKRVLLIEQNAARTTALGPDHQTALPDGRHQVVWRTLKPHLFEKYMLHWEW